MNLTATMAAELADILYPIVAAPITTVTCPYCHTVRYGNDALAALDYEAQWGDCSAECLDRSLIRMGGEARA